MDFVTLNMLIIDDIHYLPPKPPSLDVLGGAGSYAVLGARLYRPAPASRKIGWVVHKGFDFPVEIKNEIDSWQTDCDFQDTAWRKTTRAWNGYRDDEQRDFNFLTDKLRVDHTHLGTRQLKARVFHFMCTPRRCIDFVENILKQRRQVLEAEGESAVSPYFIWEPVPDACSPQELAGVEEALKYIDVVSPNHHELAMLYAATQSPRGAKDDMDKMKEQCEKLWNAWERQGRDRAIVVRCGEQGCFLKTETKQFILPAYHEPPSDSGHPKVVDPTGAGNAFLGAFAMGMLDSPDPSQKILHAGLYGTIAASFAIEQVGLPKLRIIEGVEVWNGVRVEQRLQELRNR